MSNVFKLHRHQKAIDVEMRFAHRVGKLDNLDAVSEEPIVNPYLTEHERRAYAKGWACSWYNAIHPEFRIVRLPPEEMKAFIAEWKRNLAELAR